MFKVWYKSVFNYHHIFAYCIGSNLLTGIFNLFINIYHISDDKGDKY